MSEQNVERCLEGYARFNEGERVPTLEFWHEDGEYHASSADPDSAVHRGLDAVSAQYKTWVDAYPDLKVEPLDVKGHGEKVFVWVRFVGHGAASGVPIDMELAHVVTYRDGRIALVAEYTDRSEGLRAAGFTT